MLSSIFFRYIISSTSYIDRDRVGVMGTNYGGYLAAMVMAQSSIVKCGVFTSPVTDWIDYGNCICIQD